jgi:adenylate cyclase
MQLSRRLPNAVLLAALIGASGSILVLLPWGIQLEESVGLRWLFRDRGRVLAPRDVVIVSIDKRSSAALGFDYETKAWDRRRYAELVDGLTRAGASVVVFDLLFREARPAQDAVLAAAMRRAGNVLLLEHLEKRETRLDASERPSDHLVLHRLIPPTEVLRAAAVASGPFTLPKVPLQVAQFWTFDKNAGDTPSLPVLALLRHATLDYERLADRVAEQLPSLAELLPRSSKQLNDQQALARLASRLFDALRNDPLLVERMSAASHGGSKVFEPQAGPHDPIDSLLQALRPPQSRYLNFYGPPMTLSTVSFADALAALSGTKTLGEEPIDWRDKVVFIGLSSPVQWQQDDEFITVFSDTQTGHDLSGIEILATAFGNLLHDTALRVPSPLFHAMLVLGWGLLIGFASRLFLPGVAFGVLFVAATGYTFATRYAFASAFVWLPLVIPLLVQAPLALFATTALHYREAKQDKARIREAFRYYLPEPVVDRLVREGFHPTQYPETVFGICLYTDAEQYTKLAEQMTPDALTAFMNEYFELLFGPVKMRGGIVSDVVGDAMMAIWAARKGQKATREAACRAAIDIQSAVTRHCAGQDYPALPTRIGLHCGAIALANVGAGEHYEYRAVGDVVNTASRLEQLNKRLGTRVLVSGETIADLDGALARYLGKFVLSGKSSSVAVFELLAVDAPDDHPERAALELFSEAVRAFEREEWEAARRDFRVALTRRPADGPANYYLAQMSAFGV